jgi:hypothetical protein
MDAQVPLEGPHGELVVVTSPVVEGQRSSIHSLARGSNVESVTNAHETSRVPSPDKPGDRVPWDSPSPPMNDMRHARSTLPSGPDDPGGQPATAVPTTPTVQQICVEQVSAPPPFDLTIVDEEYEYFPHPGCLLF